MSEDALSGICVSQRVSNAPTTANGTETMTTLATIAGLAPLAFGFGSGAEIQRPLAVAVIGGLAVSTSVSLLVLPSLVRLVQTPRFRG